MIIDWTPTELGQYVASCHQRMLDHERTQIDQLEASTHKHQKAARQRFEQQASRKLLGNAWAYGAVQTEEGLITSDPLQVSKKLLGFWGKQMAEQPAAPPPNVAQFIKGNIGKWEPVEIPPS